MRVSPKALVALLFIIGLICSNPARGANWTNASGDSSWNNAANWDAGVPNGIDTIANFTLDITSDALITLDGDKTTGTLIFNDIVSSSNWILNPGNPGTSKLTLDVSTGSALITVRNASAIPTNG